MSHLSLDDLFSEAQRAQPIPAKPTKRPTPEVPRERQLLMDPDQWTRTRGIALIHKETGTLLGNFSEYLHRTIPDCRKLLREEAPISISATETVEGSWWLGEGRRPEARREWHEQRPAIIHAILPELKLHAPCCEVLVHLSYGAIARVELMMDTRFAQTEGPEALFDLPGGTNILEVMGLECKMNLRKEIGL